MPNVENMYDMENMYNVVLTKAEIYLLLKAIRENEDYAAENRDYVGADFWKTRGATIESLGPISFIKRASDNSD